MPDVYPQVAQGIALKLIGDGERRLIIVRDRTRLTDRVAKVKRTSAVKQADVLFICQRYIKKYKERK